MKSLLASPTVFMSRESEEKMEKRRKNSVGVNVKCIFRQQNRQTKREILSFYEWLRFFETRNIDD